MSWPGSLSLHPLSVLTASTVCLCSNLNLHAGWLSSCTWIRGGLGGHRQHSSAHESEPNILPSPKCPSFPLIHISGGGGTPSAPGNIASPGLPSRAPIHSLRSSHFWEVSTISRKFLASVPPPPSPVSIYGLFPSRASACFSASGSSPCPASSIISTTSFLRSQYTALILSRN